MDLKDHDYNLKLTLVLLVVFLAVIACCFIVESQRMRNVAEERWVKITAYQTEAVKARNINNVKLFKMVNEIRMDTWKLKVDSQRDLNLIFRQLEKIEETILNDVHYLSRDKWLERMSPEYREIFEKEEIIDKGKKQSYIVSYKELALLVEELVKFTGYNRN